MQSVSEFIQPVLIALAVLLIPACARWLKGAFTQKLDEGREIATKNRTEMDATATQRHHENVERFDRIERQTTITNGKVAEHDKAITVLKAETEMLTKLYLKGSPE